MPLSQLPRQPNERQAQSICFGTRYSSQGTSIQLSKAMESPTTLSIASFCAGDVSMLASQSGAEPIRLPWRFQSHGAAGPSMDISERNPISSVLQHVFGSTNQNLQN